jgi:hypothetical protein
MDTLYNHRFFKVKKRESLRVSHRIQCIFVAIEYNLCWVLRKLSMISTNYRRREEYNAVEDK